MKPRPGTTECGSSPSISVALSPRCERRVVASHSKAITRPAANASSRRPSLSFRAASDCLLTVMSRETPWTRTGRLLSSLMIKPSAATQRTRRSRGSAVGGTTRYSVFSA